MKTEKNAIGQLQKAYDSLAWMNLTAHLYDLTEGVRDGRYGMDGNLLDKDTDDCYGQLLGHIRDYAEAGENARERILKALPKLREHVTERAEQVQVFSDALMIYEYLFNRAEYSFRTYDKPFDNEEEAKEILRAVFRSEDSAETNLRIQIMLSQLPIWTKVKNLLLTGQNVNLHGICGVPLTAVNTVEAIIGQGKLLQKINNV